MEWENIISVLKWIGLVFIAGLIGYFGKYIGKLIIAYFSLNNKDKEKENLKLYSTENEVDKKQLKLEKKKIKLEKKRLKKENK